MKGPILIYDGDCGFCIFWVERWKKMTRGRVEYTPYQEAAKRFPQIPAQDFPKAIKFILPNGRVFSGAHAILRALAVVPEKRWMLWIYRKIPGAGIFAELFYMFVAGNRGFFSLLTRLFLVQSPHSHILTRWLFLKVLGIVYFVAFISFAVQTSGLIGSGGILPAENFLGVLAKTFGPTSFWSFPTLAWFNVSDGFLQFMGFGGAFLSLLLIFGIAITPILVLLWVFYLSLFTVGQVFMSYQWDILLLEVGFLAIFLDSGSSIVIWLFRWLLFRFMFISGAVKLLSGDPVWRNLSALNFHYETQPLPNIISWYAHQLPEWIQKTSAGTMFFIQLVLPFLIFAPRRLRFFAAFAIILLESLIFFTGNYNFFNILTISLCIFLLDDTFIRRFFPKKFGLRIIKMYGQKLVADSLRGVLIVFAIIIIFMSSSIIFTNFFGVFPWPAGHIYKIIDQFHIVNSYGLFAVMTTSRPEIFIEGSNDGETWLAYGFKYKAGDLSRRPKWVAPHQPRIDWQMWFEGLNAERNMKASDDPATYHYNIWFKNFVIRLLEGSPDVLALLDDNPFTDAPPKYIRAVVYNYHFTNFAERKETGNWWKREYKGAYLSPVALE
ncbi:MAG: lipase maturation factor family protein [Candidatus Spechtbacterales bacterium]